MDKLLPCPFCSHPAPHFERRGSRRQSYIVACGSCGCRHESSDEGRQSGSSWNERVQPPSRSTTGNGGVDPFIRDALDTMSKAAACNANYISVTLPSADWQRIVDAFGALSAPALGIDAPEQPCKTELTSSRMCEKGTKSCVIHHDAPEQQPVAVIRFERSTPGSENEMPKLVSCNWLPDGEYQVFTAASAVQPRVWLAEAERLAMVATSSLFRPDLNALLAHLRAHPAAQQGDKP